MITDVWVAFSVFKIMRQTLSDKKLVERMSTWEQKNAKLLTAKNNKHTHTLVLWKNNIDAAAGKVLFSIIDWFIVFISTTLKNQQLFLFSQKTQGNTDFFWNYFYTKLAILIMAELVKQKG